MCYYSVKYVTASVMNNIPKYANTMDIPIIIILYTLFVINLEALLDIPPINIIHA